MRVQEIVGAVGSLECADCGATFVSDGFTPGYATYPGEVRVCYACTDKRELAALMSTVSIFIGYLSADGASVTTWTGGVLARVTYRNVSRTGWRDCTGRRSEMTHIRAVDAQGARWYGKGAGRGMAIRIRRAKVTP